VSATDVEDDARREATVRPRRALVLIVLSRSALVALVAVVAWVFQQSLGASSEPEALAIPRSSVMTDAGGTEVARFVEDLVDSATAADARLVDVELGAPTSRRAPVRLRVEVSGRGAGEVDRLVRRLSSVGLEDLVPQGVTPVAGGAIVDLEGSVLLRPGAPSGAPPVAELAAAVGPQQEVRPALVVLSEVVEQVGVDLRRLELRGELPPLVRLDTSGTIDGIVALLGAIERQHGGPLGLRSLLLRSLPDARWDLDLTFRSGADRSAAAGRTR